MMQCCNSPSVTLFPTTSIFKQSGQTIFLLKQPAPSSVFCDQNLNPTKFQLKRQPLLPLIYCSCVLGGGGGCFTWLMLCGLHWSRASDGLYTHIAHWLCKNDSSGCIALFARREGGCFACFTIEDAQEEGFWEGDAKAHTENQ